MGPTTGAGDTRRHAAPGEDRSGMPRALIQLTVRVEPATYEAALRAAQATGLSLSAWLARVIRERAEQEAARETGEPDASAGPGSPGDAARR
jgi:hypothetical protein